MTFVPRAIRSRKISDFAMAFALDLLFAIAAGLVSAFLFLVGVALFL